jgi:Mg2+ and Co2+ transporter CorA
MDDLTSRFIDAFAKIEKHLRKILDANKYTTFNELVERALTQDKSVRRLRDHLKALADLRNFLVHEYSSTQPLAFPSESTVLRMDRLATVDDALSEFDDHMHAGKMLDAIILTQNGNERERPLGIVTATDQPKLRSAIRV